MSEYVVRPQEVEEWTLGKHEGVTSKLLVDGANMTVLFSRWSSGAIAPEHLHAQEQIGICLQGKVTLTIEGRDHQVGAGHLYHIPGDIRHAERNDGEEEVILVDFFSPVRGDLIQRRFEARVI